MQEDQMLDCTAEERQPQSRLSRSLALRLERSPRGGDQVPPALDQEAAFGRRGITQLFCHEGEIALADGAGVVSFDDRLEAADPVGVAIRTADAVEEIERCGVRGMVGRSSPYASSL